MSDLASMPAVKPRDKHTHRSKYYLPMTTESMLQNLESQFGLPAQSIDHHLANMAIHRNAAMLCQEVVGYLDSQVALGNNEQEIPWHMFLAESRGHHLQRMSLDQR